MKCEGKIEMYVGVNHDRLTHVQCGTTGAYGSIELCDPCLREGQRMFPQGWKYKPGDTCRHGVYNNPEHDCCCARCENGDD